MPRSRLVVWTPIVLALGVAASTAAASRVLFEERFEAPLDEAWYWVRGDAEKRRVENGALSLFLEPGGLFKDHNSGINFLLRPLPESASDFLVEVELLHRPGGIYENAGLILYRDDDNHVVVNKELYLDRDPPLRVQLVLESEGEPTFHYVAYSSERVVLGMRIRDGEVTGLYKPTPGGPWKTVGRIALPEWDDPSIGLEATYGEDGADRWARFDNFRVSSE